MKMLSRFFCVLFLVVRCFDLYSQIEPSLIEEKKLEYDTNYYITYYDKLALRLYGVTKSNEISQFDDLTNTDIQYRPNDRLNVGVGFSYKWLNLDLALNFPFINDDDEVFGETERIDLQGNIYLRKLIVDVNFQLYDGYYVDNPEDYIPNFTPNPSFPLRGDISTFSIGAQAFYLLNNKRLSLRSSFLYNERQKRSAGSPIFGPYVLFFRLEADSSIIPTEIINEVNPEINFSSTRFVNAGVNIGYVHSFVIKERFFLTPFIAVGLGTETRSTNALEKTLSQKGTIFSPNLSARFAAGYNSDKFYTGFSVLFETTGSVQDEPLLEYSINNLRFFIGKRFEAPNFLKSKKNRKRNN